MTEALAALEAELKRDPASRKFAELAREYQRLGRIEEAKVLCEQGLQRHPTLWQARLLLAQIQMAQGDLEGAGASVQKILLPLPDNVAANHLAGDIYAALGDRSRALRHYQVVDLFEPGRADVARHIAELTAPEPEAAPAPQAAPPPVPAAVDEPPQTMPLVEAGPSEAAPEPVEEAPAEPTLQQALESALGEEPPAEVPVSAPPVEAPAPPVASLAVEDFAGTIRIPTWTNEAEVAGPPEPEDVDQTAPSQVLVGEDLSFADLGGEEEGLGESLLDAHEQTLLEMPVARAAIAPAPAAPPPAAEEPAAEVGQASQGLRAVPDLTAADTPALSTTTLAELYSQQGFPEKAVEIYQRILLQDPDRPDIKRKVQELMQRISGEAPEIPEVQQEDVRRALRQRRVQVLEGWLRRVKEERHV